MSVGGNIKRYRKAKKWTQDDLAAHIGVTKSMVSLYEANKAELSVDKLKSLAQLLDVKVEQIVESESTLGAISEELVSEMRSGKLLPAQKAQLFLSQLPEKDAADYIPYYDVEITAGRIEQYFDDVEEMPEGYVYAPQYRGCVMCNVKGNSMYNLIYPGARLYVYQLHDKKYIDFGQIYLVVLNTMRVLKYIRRHPSDDTKITLSSHNKEHDDWDVEKADIINLFQVKGFENQLAM
jgi:transcriptional regulator with XRE-family HTH domain